MSILINLSAATLGAGFYTLFTAYNTIDLLRFSLGIVSGVMLANFGPNIGAKEYNPILLGLIGGYSSEAVNQILLRVTEVLVAAIKGSGKDDFKQREAVLQAEAKNQQILQRQQMVTTLGDVLRDAIDKQAPPEVIDSIKKAMDELNKS